MQPLPEYRLQKVLIATTGFLSVLYVACAFWPAYVRGLYRLSTEQILNGGVIPVGSSGGLGTLVLLATVFFVLVPVLGVTLVTLIVGHKRLHWEQRFFWIALIVEVIAFFLLSYPITDTLVVYILYL